MSELNKALDTVERLMRERNEILWALRWASSFESSVHYFGNSEEVTRKQDEQILNNEKALRILEKYHHIEVTQP